MWIILNWFASLIKKSLHGLKQASRQWYSKFSEALKSRGYENSKNDYFLFSRKSGDSEVFLAIYVDDILFTRTDVDEI